MNRIYFFLLCAFPVFAFGQKPITYYVATTGKDTNPGTIEKPFASLEKARDVIRSQKKERGSGSFAVYLRKGSYFLANSFVLDSLDSGTKERPITYSAYANEEVH